MNPRLPILFLLAALLLTGLFTFSDYGLSWDEPLFYDYAESIQGAYQGWDKFDESVYGRSAHDHKFYGPAYLLLGRPLKLTLQAFGGMDDASAWHLVNFFSFLLGIYFLYRLGTRFLTPNLAAVNAAFFALQPLLWGHAFINPKDIPFMTAFLAAITLGLEWVDSPNSKTLAQNKKIFHAKPQSAPSFLLIKKIFAFFAALREIFYVLGLNKLILATLALGIASAIRVIGPLAGVLVFVYFLLSFIRLPRAVRPLSLIHLSAYILLSILLMFSLWPFLWADPVSRLLAVLVHMSNNPTELAVLFRAEVFPANELPARYFPQMLVLTLSEPFVPLAILGGLRMAWLMLKKRLDWRAPLVLFLWFTPLAAYNILKVPSMYDGIRHFFFMLPPLFILTGMGMEWVSGIGREVSGIRLRTILNGLLVAVLLLSGILAIIRLHPYQYTYYNSLPDKTYRVYENDYWLTCYKEAIAWVRENEPGQPLYIQREFRLASYYGDGMDLRDLRYETPETLTEPALLLFSTRSNLDQRSEFRRAPVIHAIGREGVEFCLVKEFTP
jgi:4-amino-4-deoxy-L-arabinose transferase-like glycosyltransferase